MGDNIYLGDRNGVRTPMQWSSDRNGGFSRADPARLFAPPIQDPVYGYQAINVEAQERYPFSLLNWMKRMVALRRQHPVFGRGSLEFVGCPEPEGPRLSPPRRSRNDPRRRQPVARRAAGRARSGGVRRPDAGRDERPDRVSAHRRPAVLPDARPVRVVLVHAAAGIDARSRRARRRRPTPTRRSSTRCRRC